MKRGRRFGLVGALVALVVMAAAATAAAHVGSDGDDLTNDLVPGHHP